MLILRNIPWCPYDPSTWRIGPQDLDTWCSYHGNCESPKDRDCKSPKDRVVGPLPNGLFMAYINGGDLNHLQVLG